MRKNNKYLFMKISFFESVRFLTYENVSFNSVDLYIVMLTSNSKLKRENFSKFRTFSSVTNGQYFYNIKND